MNIEQQYLSVMENILENGERKSNRTGIDTLVIPTVMLQHDMSKGFPLLTSKKMYTRAILVELEGFLKGITSKEWYQERKCRIWNEWSNPVSDDKDDLGAIYGMQWRRFNQEYVNGKPNKEALPPSSESYDQLANIINTLQTNPNDRRMLCFAWNPLQKYQQALPACHLGFNVQHINGKLHLTWFQRSCDFFLGIPFNVASYAALLEIICAHVGMKAGTLSGVLCDTHIYENHIDQCRQQLSNTPYDLPTVKFKDPVDIFNWEYTNFEVCNYKSHESIKGDVAI